MELLLRYPDWKDRALTFSYDDGTEQDAWLIEKLAQAGMRGTFNLNSGMFRPEERPKSKTALCRRLSASEAKALYSAPHVEVAAHGRLHEHLEFMTNARQVYEFASDKAALEKLFGRLVCGGAYAYGTYAPQTPALLAACGLGYCRTVRDTEEFRLPENFLTWNPTCRHTNPRLMALADRFLSEPVKLQPRLFYLWGHTFELERDNGWDGMEAFLRTMAHIDALWYAANGEIYRYVQAFHRLETGSDGTILYNPTAQKLWLLAGGERRTIAPGETLFL